MGCLFVIFAAVFPRIGTILIWLDAPHYFRPRLAEVGYYPFWVFCFFPFTTLMYVIIWSPGVGLAGFDWLWLVFALGIDLASIGSAVYANKERVPV